MLPMTALRLFIVCIYNMMLFLSLRLIFGYRRISVYHSCVHMSNTIVIPDIICVCTSIEWVTQSKQQIKQTSKCRMGTG